MFENRYIRPSKNPKELLYCQLTFKALYILPPLLDDKILHSRNFISMYRCSQYCTSRFYINIYLIFIGLSSAESPGGTQPTPSLEKEEALDELPWVICLQKPEEMQIPNPTPHGAAISHTIQTSTSFHCYKGMFRSKYPEVESFLQSPLFKRKQKSLECNFIFTKIQHLLIAYWTQSTVLEIVKDTNMS